MSAGGIPPPADNTWIAAVHKSAFDFEPLGAGVVIDDRRVLTAAHVAVRADADPENLWVAFPMASEDARCRVARILLPEAHASVKDLAILFLEDPVPTAVAPAPLRNPKPADLIGRRWWAFGFPDGDELGNDANGTIGSPLAYGWVRLDTESRYQVERGFSGTGLWSPDYEAVIAIVGQDHTRGDGRAITLHQAIKYFPDQSLSQLSERMVPAHAGELALTAWGWSLSDDPEGVRHWRPRARGVSINSERGYRFRGRIAALSAIISWLDRVPLDARVLVITGAPGAGKSAVLGRVVTTSDPIAAAELPAWDIGVRATPGSVACAVHSKGKTALEVATEIARAASAALPERVEDFAPALRDALIERAESDQWTGLHRFNVIIDALDESAEARVVIAKVILPLAETCADVGARVVVGSRRRDDDGELLTAFGTPMRVVDLDANDFFAEEDLAAYAQATLQLDRPGNPYAENDVAIAVAVRIAQLSEGNFLVAGLTARTHGLYDDDPVDPAVLSFAPTVDAAMREYLHRLPPIGGVPAETLLTALAFAEAPGIPATLWCAAVRALGFTDVPTAALARFARSSAANFLVESSGEDGRGAVFRLFHQALNDTLLKARAEAAALADDERTVAAARHTSGAPLGENAALTDDERGLTQAFMAFGRDVGWARAPAYLLRSLPAHAARGGLLDVLLGDENYLLYADLLRLLPFAGQAESAPGRQRVRLLRLAPPGIINADASTRAAMLSVTEALEGLGDDFARSTVSSPYTAAWAEVSHSMEQQVLSGHTARVSAVCAFALGDRILLATGSDDRTVRIWDPATGVQLVVLQGHTDWVTTVCAFAADGRTFLATGSHDGTVRIWDPATGIQHTVLEIGEGAVYSMCGLTLNGRAFLAVGSHKNVSIWDLVTEAPSTVLRGHESAVLSLCDFTLEGETLLASASRDGTVRVWDPATGVQREILREHSDVVNSVCAFTLNGRALLATGSLDKAVHAWDPATGTRGASTYYHTDWISAVCAFTLNGRTLLAASSADKTIRIWDPATGTPVTTLRGHSDWVRAVCALVLDGRTLLATAGSDATVRIWDPGRGTRRTIAEGETSAVTTLCTLTVEDRTLLATNGSASGSIRIWEPATGAQRTALHGEHTVTALCALPLDGRTLLAVGCDGGDGAVQIWEPTIGSRLQVMNDDGGTRPYTGIVNDMCLLATDGRPFLVVGGEEIRLWDPETNTSRRLGGYTSEIRALCALMFAKFPQRAFLATAGTVSSDDVVRIWALDSPYEPVSLEGDRGTVNALCTFTLNGQTFLAAGYGNASVGVWIINGDELLDMDVRPYTLPAQGQFLEGHESAVNTVCAFTVTSRTLLASGSDDRTVRIWDPLTATTLLVVPTRDEVLALAHADGMLFVGTNTGLLTLRLNI